MKRSLSHAVSLVRCVRSRWSDLRRGDRRGLRHRNPERTGNGPGNEVRCREKRGDQRTEKSPRSPTTSSMAKTRSTPPNMVVTAGFIDTHTHSSNKFNIKMSMMDGVTSGMDFEAGALNIAAWYDREAGKWPMNYGQCASQELARMVVHDGMDLSEPVDAAGMFDARSEALKDDDIPGWSVTVSNLDQINMITKILDENLRQGALCVGSTVGYMSKGVSTYEMFEAQRAAARYGRLTAMHSRFHTSSKTPTEAQLGFAEVFTNAVLLKAPMLYQHNNDYGWWEIEEKLQMARETGTEHVV